MNLSRKISPVWAAVVSSSFVAAIVIPVSQKMNIDHEPVILSSPSHHSLAVAFDTTPSQHLSLRNATAVEQWSASGDAELDQTCNGIKDYFIGQMRQNTDEVLREMKKEDTNDFQSWFDGYVVTKMMRQKYGTAVEGCVHPTLFNQASIQHHIGKLHEFVNAEMATATNTNISVQDRYAAWERVENFLFMNLGVGDTADGKEMRQAVLNDAGYSEEEFQELGWSMARPLVEQTIAELDKDVANLTAADSKEYLKSLSDKHDRAQAMSWYNHDYDDRLSALRVRLQYYSFAYEAKEASQHALQKNGLQMN